MQSWDAEKNQFSNFCELWEKAQSDQIFKNTPKPSDADYVDPFSPNVSEFSASETQNWSQIYDRTNHVKTDDNQEIVLCEKQESFSDFERVKTSKESKGSKKTRKRKVSILAKQPNRVTSDTIDSDTVDDENMTRVTSGFGSDENMEKLVDLHHKKYEKEVERNKAYPNEEQKVKKLEQEIKKLRDEIAKLSDEFYGTYDDNEYYA